MSDQLPFLQEHQSPEANSTSPSEYTPTTEEKKAVKLVDRLFDKAKEHRRKYDEKWLDYYKMFRGKQWFEQRPSYRHSEVINFIFQSIQSIVPIMTDARPKFDFLPTEPSDYELSAILSDVAQSDWERHNWLMDLTEVVYDGHFYGIGLLEIGYDHEWNFGEGTIDLCSFDPFYAYPDPEARDVNKKSRYFVTAVPTDIEEVKKKYPDKKEYLKPDLVDLMQGDKTELDQVKFKSPTDNKTLLEGSSTHDLKSKDRVLVKTLWILDEEIEEEEQDKVGDDGNPVTNELGEVETEFVQKKKYPRGRKVVTANGILLEDGPNEYEDGKFPYGRYVNYILPREFHGMSDVEQLQSPQKMFNRLVSYALDVLMLMGNPIWKVGANANVDTDNLFNAPGTIVEADDISQVQREEGVQLQPYVLQLIDRMSGWFDGISGANDVTRGIRPEGVSAAAAISTLQEASQTRIRLKSRNLDALLQNAGQMWVSRAFQFYTVPRVFRLTNNGAVEKYFKFHVDRRVDETTGEESKVAVIRNFNKTEDGRFLEDPVAKEIQIRGDFDVRVTTGSALPFEKDRRANLAFKLFENGVIDEPELLKAVSYPNWEAVWERVQQKREAEAQAQAEAEAAAQGAPTMDGEVPPPGPAPAV